VLCAVCCPPRRIKIYKSLNSTSLRNPANATKTSRPIALRAWEPVSELRSATCLTGSDSVTSVTRHRWTPKLHYFDLLWIGFCCITWSTYDIVEQIHDKLQRRRGLKSRETKSCNFRTNSCKFPTQEINDGCSKFQFCPPPNFSKMGISTPNFVLREQFFDTKKNYVRGQKLGGLPQRRHWQVVQQSTQKKNQDAAQRVVQQVRGKSK